MNDDDMESSDEEDEEEDEDEEEGGGDERPCRGRTTAHNQSATLHNQVMVSTLSPTGPVAIARSIGGVADSSACFSNRRAFSVCPHPVETSAR